MKGIVFDKKLNEPVWNASVYLDGTSFNTITNEDGSFELTINSDITTQLVIRFIGYEKVTFDYPFNLPDTIFLEERPEMINELVVEAKEGKFTRARKMKAFKTTFLGTTKAGKSCEILNEDDINLIFDTENNVLIATANTPIIIDNKYLGYTVYYDLVEFQAQYKTNSLNDSQLHQTYYLGTFSFQEKKNNNQRILLNRSNTYDKSISNFIRNLYNKTLDKSNFSFSKNEYRLSADECFVVRKGLGNCQVIIQPPILGARKSVDRENYTEIGYVDVWYKDEQSSIIFYTDKFQINRTRITAPLDKVAFSGEMGEQRVGDLLPWEYSDSD
ncbi:carboxypeptidase-like regulatory domain-containing protein [Parabacteroides sp. OttesenSCG-928-G07]|nr:carboxypeptidase-like regulatory domain-containing protein [Parabacteroides sp. OttesenSCG-928-G07]